MKTLRNGATRARRGAAIIEMALVTPLLLLVLIGIIEFGWLFHVKSSLTTASRVGARTGTLPGATVEQVLADVDEALTVMGFDPAQYPFDIDVTMATEDEPFITVSVVVPYANASIVQGFFGWLQLQEIRGITSLRDEDF